MAAQVQVSWGTASCSQIAQGCTNLGIRMGKYVGHLIKATKFTTKCNHNNISYWTKKTSN